MRPIEIKHASHCQLRLVTILRSFAKQRIRLVEVLKQTQDLRLDASIGFIALQSCIQELTPQRIKSQFLTKEPTQFSILNHNPLRFQISNQSTKPG